MFSAKAGLAIHSVAPQPSPYIDVLIANHPVTALLDSGATRSFVNPRVLNAILNLNPKLQCTKIDESCLVANSHNSVVSDSFKAPLKFENFAWKFEFRVLKDLPVDLVLGTDFLSHCGVVLNLQDKNLSFTFAPDLRFPFKMQIPLMCNSISPSVPHHLIPLLQHLPPDQQAHLAKVLDLYPDVLTEALGHTSVGMCHLELTDPTPFHCSPYVLTPPKLKLLREHINQLLESKVIVESTSDYASACFLVPKKGNKQRLVVDYRRLNSKIKFDAFPLPTIEGALMHFSGAKYFSILDLNSAYHQISLSKASQRYCSFVTPFGSYSFQRLPYGLSIGAQTLSRIIQNVFPSSIWEHLFVYLDDLLIFSKDFNSHMLHLKEVFGYLRAAGFTVNPSKASFCVKEVSYLGHVISDKGITVNPERIEVIQSVPIPKNVKQVRRFIGMCGFYARFIPNFSHLSAPLNLLKRKGVRFKWGPEQQSAFQKLKLVLSSPPVLQVPNFNEQFTLQTDASDFALGAVLQQTVDDQLAPVAFASRLLTPAELKFSAYEKEALAALWGCEKFAKFLNHNKFILHTDNQALSWLQRQSMQTGRIGRWIHRLSGFSFEIKHIPGCDNQVADCLSRLFEEDSSSDQKGFLLQDFPLSFTNLLQHQKEDAECSNLFKRLEKKEIVLNYEIFKGILYYAPKKCKRRIVLPKVCHQMIIKYFHSTTFGGHLGMTKTLKKINKQYFWVGMCRDIKSYVRTCHDCQMSKPSPNTRLGLHSAAPASRPWECLHIDHVGPYPRSNRGNIGILSMIDAFSKFVLLFPVTSINTQITIDILVHKVFGVFGPPKVIVSDNHAIFTSTAFKDMCFAWGISHRHTTPYRPHSSNVERFHRNLKSALIIHHHKAHKHWDETLHMIQLAFNSSWHVSTNTTPSALFLGYELQHPLALAWNFNFDQSPEESSMTLSHKWELAYQALEKARCQVGSRYNASHRKHPFKIDDQVLCESHVQSSAATGVSAKLSLRWNGPYLIEKFVSPVTCILKHPSSGVKIRQAHVSQLKHYFERT